MKDKKNYLWVWVIVVVLIVLIIIFILNMNREKSSNQNAQKQITISKEDFAFVKSTYLNAQQYSAPDCSKKTCHSDNLTFDCPKPDLLTLYFKIVNINNSLKSQLSCDIQDGTDKVVSSAIDGKWKFFINEQTGLIEMGHLNSDYSKPHELIICCKIQNGDVASNEICLTAVKIESLC